MPLTRSVSGRGSAPFASMIHTCSQFSPEANTTWLASGETDGRQMRGRSTSTSTSTSAMEIRAICSMSPEPLKTA